MQIRKLKHDQTNNLAVLQLDQINMAVCFWYLVKSDLFIIIFLINPDQLFTDPDKRIQIRITVKNKTAIEPPRTVICKRVVLVWFPGWVWHVGDLSVHLYPEN